MGMSNAYGGPGGGTPLVPSWLEGDGDAADGAGPDGGATPDGAPPPQAPTAPPNRPPPQAPPLTDRFTAARSNFSRFAGSGGSDRASLGRAISNYVSRSAGGSRPAAQRMGSSRRAGARLLGFLCDAQARGAQEALRALNLEGLAGRPIEEIFLGLADFICPEGGTVDEGIARDAFIETIADLASLGVIDLDALTADQMQTVFEFYATHAIEARICNDIGTKAVTLPTDRRAAERVQAQLRDFVRRGVGDALGAARAAIQALTPDRVLGFVSGVYQAAFETLQTLGDAERAR
jgi:hypothetical protein